MDTINIEDAETDLTSLVEKAAQGESFIIAKAGKPIAKVVPIDQSEEPAPHKKIQRIGFMEGHGVIPDDIKAFAKDEIDEMFGLKE